MTSPPGVAGRITPTPAENPNPSHTAKPSRPSHPAKSGRPTKILPTDRVQFPKQLNLIRAYAAVSGQTGRPAPMNEVAKVANLNPSTVSLCNGFFADHRFIEKTANGSYVPSAETLSFLRAFQWNQETAPQKLAPLLRHSWFAKAIAAKLAMGGREESEVIDDLAEAAHASPKDKAKLIMLIDYLEAAGIVRRDGSLIREGKGAETDNGREPDMTPAPAAVETRETRPPILSTAFSQPTEGVVQFHVSVKVDMAEFAGWKADRIAAFFAGIAQVLAAKGALETDASG